MSSICGNLAKDYGLCPLRELGRELPAVFYFREMTRAESAFVEWSCQYVGGSHGIHALPSGTGNVRGNLDIRRVRDYWCCWLPKTRSVPAKARP